MANEEHLAILKKGVKEWNAWREENRTIRPDLSEVDLIRTDLSYADLSYADLSYANLSGADLIDANLIGANLNEADLSESNLSGVDLSAANLFEANLGRADLKEAELIVADLRGANLRGANLSEADLRGVDLRKANLSEADLSEADLIGVDLRDADLREANLSGAILGSTLFINIDLSQTKGLEECKHRGPSTIDHRTLARSGRLPDVFLRGIGLPEHYLEYIPGLFWNRSPIEFYSCFISYSSTNEEFAKRLHNDLQAEGVRCWFAPEDIQGGKKIRRQLDDAIRLHDKLILILSEASMNSGWVAHEIMQSRKREVAEGRQMLFPISVAPFEKIKEWDLFDADTATHIGREIRSYYIPDFSNWKDHDSYQAALKKLLGGLRAEGE